MRSTLMMVLLAGLPLAAPAATLMDAPWAAAACAQWNRTPELLDGLADKWVKNDGGKGHKVIHLYRSECGDAPKVELRVASKDGKAQCVYGGKVENATLDTSVDYTMHAKTPYWIEMGRGDYGPMRAMLTGALKFDGPKLEAMSVMGPFEAFLLLVGKVPGETSSCPGK